MTTRCALKSIHTVDGWMAGWIIKNVTGHIEASEKKRCGGGGGGAEEGITNGRICTGNC